MTRSRKRRPASWCISYSGGKSMTFTAMNRSSAAVVRVACTIILAGMLGTVPQASKAADNTDWSKVAAALGKPGSAMPGGVYRVGMPRTDLHVTLDGVELKAGFALGSWLAFRPEGDSSMVMGDLVLTETEIAPVMTKLADSGIDITALHNHLLRAQPATFYMHVLGHGDPVRLAGALHEGLGLSKTPLGNPAPTASSQPPAAASSPAAVPALDTAMIDQTLGAKGNNAAGVYQVTIRRAETIKDGAMEVP